MPDIDDIWDDDEDMAMFSARAADRVAIGLSPARAALAAAPQPAPEEGLGGAQDGAMLGVIAARRAQA